MKRNWYRNLLTAMAIAGLAMPLAAQADEGDQPQQKEIKVVAKVVDGVVHVETSDEPDSKPQIKKVVRLQAAPKTKEKSEGPHPIKLELKADADQPQATDGKLNVATHVIVVDKDGNVIKSTDDTKAYAIVVQHDGKILKTSGDAKVKVEAKPTEGSAKTKTMVYRYEVKSDDAKGQETKEVEIRVVPELDKKHNAIKLNLAEAKSEGEAFQLKTKVSDEAKADQPHAIVVRKRVDGEEVDLKVIRLDENQSKDILFVPQVKKVNAHEVHEIIKVAKGDGEKEQNVWIELQSQEGQEAKEDKPKKLMIKRVGKDGDVDVEVIELDGTAHGKAIVLRGQEDNVKQIKKVVERVHEEALKKADIQLHHDKVIELELRKKVEATKEEALKKAIVELKVKIAELEKRLEELESDRD